MRDSGMIALGFVLGLASSAAVLSWSIAELERGRSIDAMLHALAARSWKREAAK